MDSDIKITIVGHDTHITIVDHDMQSTIVDLIAIVDGQCDIWFHLPGHCVGIVHHNQLHTPSHSSRYLYTEPQIIA